MCFMLSLHETKACQSQSTCKICNKRHHTLLYFNVNKAQPRDNYANANNPLLSGNSLKLTLSQNRTLSSQYWVFKTAFQHLMLIPPYYLVLYYCNDVHLKKFHTCYLRVSILEACVILSVSMPLIFSILRARNLVFKSLVLTNISQITRDNSL